MRAPATKSLRSSFSDWCGLKTDGTLWCAGSNLYGQLGDGTGIDRTDPVQVGTANDWTTISLGFSHSCYPAGWRMARSLVLQRHCARQRRSR